MSDISCPYCEHEQEINHDDGYGFKENVKHEQECTECDKTFRFTTAIFYSYDAYCADGDCEFEIPLEKTHPNYFHCKNCENSYIDRSVT